MKIISLILIVVFLGGTLISCTEGDPFCYDIFINNNVQEQQYIYVSHTTPLYTPIPSMRIAEVSSSYCRYISYDGVAVDDYNWLTFINDYSLKFYSSDITNTANWDRWNQEDLVIEDLEGYVFYSVSITNGLSQPELFDLDNSLPFYVSTNGRIEITIKELRTNI